MTARNIKYPYAKLMIDIIGILSFIGVVITIIINFYMHHSNTAFEMGFNVTGSSFILLCVLLGITIFCAVTSTIFKRIK
ncbi:MULTISPECIES: hypothetical protein [Staphylococcus]|uniref:Uncharacterized protein n=1 Tax=Staphylococcus pseudoxylosus TaxID=2282419 RepID=A0AAQ0MHG7_9STAP|nr:MULTISPECIES: hypothetical protein [Staphylococcus]MBG3874828.1 hypothetical protein [Staphylococcus xylosus]MBM2657853.1 hypothetical protein [Staphylococcus pseudoxylosus]MBM6639073.1 hypothetical protein [Staphylococcus xylosus]MEB6332459.1 hypothetical protein [Staphylococcus pseudoxylosus]PTH91956.1 hypothetical protein BU118_12405 [Staphylococcus xylosus]